MSASKDPCSISPDLKIDGTRESPKEERVLFARLSRRPEVYGHGGPKRDSSGRLPGELNPKGNPWRDVNRSGFFGERIRADETARDHGPPSQRRPIHAPCAVHRRYLLAGAPDF